MSTKQLHIDGKPVAAEKGTLVVGGSAEGARWQIERQPQHGQNAYTITRDGSNEGWVAPDGAGRPITVRPLITTKSLPPHHPNNQLWQISPLTKVGTASPPSRTSCRRALAARTPRAASRSCSEMEAPPQWSSPTPDEGQSTGPPGDGAVPLQGWCGTAAPARGPTWSG